MKKFFLFLGLLPMLCIFSCVKEEIGNNDYIIEEGTEPIMFGTAVGSSSETRAAAITTEYIPLTSPDFRVYSYLGNTGAEYGSNVKATVKDIVSNVNIEVETDVAKYWPASSTDLDFCAYYPYEVKTGGGTIGTPAYTVADPSWAFSFTAAANYANHDDLMLAMNTSVSYRSKVSLKFYHALTRLTFEAKKKSDWSETVTITGITISGIKNSGTVEIKNSAISWSLTGTADKSYTAAISPAKTIATTSTNILADVADSFMVVPLSDGSAHNFGDAMLKISTSHGDYEKKFSVIHTGIVEAGWEPGKHVNYQLTLNPDAIIVEGVTVQPWIKTADVPVEF